MDPFLLAAGRAGKVEFDVAVVGSGAAGLVAALVTAAGVLRTLVLEKSQRIGGTSAISAAGLWIPANHLAREAGHEDSPARALDYIRACAPEGWGREEPLWTRFVDEAPRMLEFLESHSRLSFELTGQRDPYPQAVGAAACRMVSPRALRLRGLRGRLRGPMLPHFFTYRELIEHDPYHRPVGASLRLLHRLAWRLATGARGMGSALIAGLAQACLSHGCTMAAGWRATDLMVGQAGRITGVEARNGDTSLQVSCRRGVVLASGGFEWDVARTLVHFPGPVDFVTSPPGNEGDGHRMAERIGAALDHMDQANISPAVPIRYEGRLQGLSLYFHQEPNAIVVDRNGRRFVDEFRFNIGEIIDARSPSGEPIHLPAWLVTDSTFLKRSPLVRRSARSDPSWLRRSSSLRELATRIRVSPENLEHTVAQFNRFCADGHDAEFGRGGGGTLPRGLRRALEPIIRPPFLAIPFNRSFISTKGGPRMNADGQVLHRDGYAIAGLFGCGATMASPIGTWAVGAGTTLGPFMTSGYVCGQSLLREHPEAPPAPCGPSLGGSAHEQ